MQKEDENLLSAMRTEPRVQNDFDGEDNENGDGDCVQDKNGNGGGVKEKKETFAAVKARQLGYIVPLGSTVFQVSQIIGVRWDSTPENTTKVQKNVIYAKNRRRVMTVLQSEAVGNERDSEINKVIHDSLRDHL